MDIENERIETYGMYSMNKISLFKKNAEKIVKKGKETKTNGLSEINSPVFGKEKFDIFKVSSPSLSLPSLMPYLPTFREGSKKAQIQSALKYNQEIAGLHRDKSMNILAAGQGCKKKHSKTVRDPLALVSIATVQPVKEINLNNRQLERNTLKHLVMSLQKPAPSLTYINLENTGISDNDIRPLCEALYNDRRVLFLGLARNILGLKASSYIKFMLKENSYLQKLDLHWNSLKDLGCLEVFEGLCNNESLKELDLSWNGIGRKDLSSIKKISNCFENFQGLAHLDLSFNYLSSDECRVLSEGLSKNHEILGVHIVGNEGKMNSQGFLEPSPGLISIKESHLFRRIFDKDREVRILNQCWLCEKWVEFYIDFPLRSFPVIISHLIYIHLECDFYQADLLHFSDNRVCLTRVLPPGKMKCFFSTSARVFTIDSLPKHQLDSPVSRTVSYSEENEKFIEAFSLNVLEISGEPCGYKFHLNTHPRRPLFNRVYAPKRPTKKPWSLELSVFKETLPPYTLVSDCLNFDWEQSKIKKIIKKSEDQAKVKNFLRDFYISIIDTFRVLAVQSGNEYPSIGSNVLTEFLNEGDVFDEVFNMNDLGVNWNAVLNRKVYQPYNPGNALVRYEFIEILIRIAVDKFVRKKQCKTVFNALEMLVKGNLLYFIEQNNTRKWREEKILNEKIDAILKAFRVVLDSVFKIYSGKKCVPGQKPFMCLDEFRSMCLESGLIDLNTPAREVNSCFYLSIKICVDEVYEKRHVEMSFGEFLEALCRVVEISNLFRGSFKSRVLSGCKSLMKVCPKAVLDNFVVPEKEDIKKIRKEFV